MKPFRHAAWAALTLSALGLAACNRHDADTALASSASQPGVADTTMADAGPGLRSPGLPSGSDSEGVRLGVDHDTAAANGAFNPQGTVDSNPTSAGTPASTPGSQPTVAVLSQADRQFASAAAESGLYEVQVGKLAADKAKRAQVKEFAAKLVADHVAANTKLAQMVQGTHIDLPTAVPADKQKVIDRLTKLSGAEFDSQFLQTVGIKDHKADIELFEKALKEVKDPSLKDFIQSTLPNLRHHLQLAQGLAK